MPYRTKGGRAVGSQKRTGDKKRKKYYYDQRPVDLYFVYGRHDHCDQEFCWYLYQRLAASGKVPKPGQRAMVLVGKNNIYRAITVTRVDLVAKGGYQRYVGLKNKLVELKKAGKLVDQKLRDYPVRPLVRIIPDSVDGGPVSQEADGE